MQDIELRRPLYYFTLSGMILAMGGVRIGLELQGYSTMAVS